MASTFVEKQHPRDHFGRFRQKMSFTPPESVRSFEGLEGEQWGEEAFSEWVGSLDQEQRDDIRAYSNQAYAPINDFLRDKAEGEPEVKQMAKRLTDTLRSTEVPEDVKVHRLLYDPAIEDAFWNLELNGKEFRDEGFTSTTMDADMLSELDLDRGAQPMEAEINVPKGAHGAVIGGMTGFPEEQELLLAPGTTYKVRSSALGADNVLRLVLDIVEQDTDGQTAGGTVVASDDEPTNEEEIDAS